jgi:hypothetical protein
MQAGYNSHEVDSKINSNLKFLGIHELNNIQISLQILRCKGNRGYGVSTTG